MIIASPPENYQETKIYKLLATKSTPADELLNKVTSFINTVKPLQELIIAGPFRDYTLHNPNHSKKLLHLAGYIIPESTQADLSALDLAIMIMSFYLHDLGMVLTQTERERITSSDDFQDFLQVRPEFGNKLKRLREKVDAGEMMEKERLLIETSIFQLIEAALAEYLRPLHATKSRYQQLISLINASSTKNDLFNISGVSFENELVDVCISHNLNSSVLIETTGIHQERFPREHIINGLAVNLQYCAAILRLVDILDFDRERTPRSLFNALGIQNKLLPGFEISLKEWDKHLSIHTISINGDEIVISGDSHHPTIEHAIREFCKIIESEIKETQTILKQNKSEILERFQLNLPFIVRAQIRSIDYVYKDYSIKLNESAIVNLLMGENLYVNTFAAVRELIQNSIDACNLRRKLENDSYKPVVKISVHQDADLRFWLKIVDNGVGMDEYVLSNFFFKVGNSYYSSTEFKRFSIKNDVNDFVPISRFGIGLLSVFMIGEMIKVTTKNSFSSRKDHKERTLFIDGVDSLAVVTENEEGNQGTTMEVLLREDKANEQYLNRIFGFVRDTIIRPQVSIMATELDGTIFKIEPDNFIRLNNSIKSELEANGIEVIQIDFERFSNLIKGKGLLFFFVNPDKSLSFYDKNGVYLSWGRHPLKNSFLFENYLGGSRVTVNGITMSFKKIGGMYKRGKKNMHTVLDIEIDGISDIIYNVSRQKVYGTGLNTAKKEIYTSVEKGLKEIGVFSRLDNEAKKLIEGAIYRSTASEEFSESLRDKILSMIPTDITSLSIDLIEEIANNVGANPYKAKRYIVAMKHMGLISHDIPSSGELF
ncbi:MAG: ATP-binding protein [Bacteroidota bacterium]